MIVQLDPMIPVYTPKGEGYAFLVTDYSQEHHKIWTVALDNNGQIWDFPNPDIRMQWNHTMQRKPLSSIPIEKEEFRYYGGL